MISATCQFDTSLRIIAADGTTVRGDLHDHDNGRHLAPIVMPQGDIEWATYTSPRPHGDFTSGAPTDAPGELIATVTVEAASWPAVEASWEVVRGWVRAEWHFYIEHEVEGVVTRWRTRRPNIGIPSRSAVDYQNRRLTYQLRFVCQPNPTVTVV